jgi:N-acetylmuramoyl-L-alanine amidase
MMGRMLRATVRLLATVLGLGALMGLAFTAASVDLTTTAAPSPSARPVAAVVHAAGLPATATGKPLAGLTLAIDPGHQLGNHNFPAKINRLVDAGGFKKPCNTTGAATNAGVPEATVNWQVARRLRNQLTLLGATVRMTRTANSESLWGPCVNTRGRFGGRVGARLMVSLHGDGAPSSGHGFHVIAPARTSYTGANAPRSLRLARALRDALTGAGIARSTYIGGGSGLDVRSDLGTLNLASVPVAMVEMGNLRNARDAHRLTTAAGQVAYARALVHGIRAFLGR